MPKSTTLHPLQNTDGLRLGRLQQDALQAALHGLDGEVYIFGSRTNPQARGGDVDILIICNNADQAALDFTLKVTRTYQKICDERIDVAVFPPPARQSRAQKDFFETIQKVRIK